MYQFGRVLIILTMILIWWARVDSGKSPRLVDCEKYVFHPHCRGTQARKRIIETVENGKGNRICMCKSASGDEYGGHRRDLFFNSNLLTAMLARGFDVDTIYDAYSTYLSSSSVKNKNDESRGNSIINSSGRGSGSSGSRSGNSHHRDGEVVSETRIRLPLSENTIDFADTDMDLDYSSKYS